VDTPQPPADLVIEADLVARLVAEQRPDLAGEEILLHDEGWDNVTFRLGSRYAVRLPRRGEAVALLRHEQTWLPTLAKGLGVEVPVPVHHGTAAAGYPWPWSIVPWIDGVSADEARLGEGQGALLGATLRVLHGPAPPEAPTNPFRGLPLAERDAFVAERLEALATRGTDVRRLASWWRRGVEAPRSAADSWLHGDLHPRNVIVRDGVIAGIIDWGDLCRGDPATDLAVAWTVLPAPERALFWEAYGVEDGATRVRARAWAVFFGAALAIVDEERHRRMGVGIVDALRSDAEDRLTWMGTADTM